TFYRLVTGYRAVLTRSRRHFPTPAKAGAIAGLASYAKSPARQRAGRAFRGTTRSGSEIQFGRQLEEPREVLLAARQFAEVRARPGGVRIRADRRVADVEALAAEVQPDLLRDVEVLGQGGVQLRLLWLADRREAIRKRAQRVGR